MAYRLPENPAPYPENPAPYPENPAPYPTAQPPPYPGTFQDPVPVPHQDNISEPTTEESNNFVSSKFSDKSIRQGFIRKVYITLTFQLLLTFAIVCVFVLVKPVRYWIRRNVWAYYLSYVVFIITYFVLGCIMSVRRKAPGNYICLVIFTLALSYVAGAIGAFHGTEAALIAVAVTTALCLAITLFAIQTRIDFTMCNGLLYAVGVVVFFTGLACLIVYFTLGPNRVLQGVYGGLVTLLFSLYLVYDTQRIIGGRKYDLDPEEYIFGAMQLYVDVVFIFMAVTGIASAAS